jgi:hypothetical protein
MQGVESRAIAEDSCFIKYHPQDGGGGTRNAPGVLQDAEKAAVNVEAPPVVDEKNISREAPPAQEKTETNDASSGENPHRTNSKTPGMAVLDSKDDFPEGGLKAWSVVVGGFCGSFSVFALINSTGVLLEYLQTHQLRDYSSSQISWIFGVELFLTFFCGAPVGPIFDAYGPRAMVFTGSILLAASVLLLGLCTRKFLSFFFDLQD